MSKTTVIKALVAGGAVIGGILLSDNEKVRTRLSKVLDIASDVERAIKNPLGTLAKSAYASQPARNMNYYDWQNQQDERRYEMERLKLQHEHEERMAEMKYKNETEPTTKKEETKHVEQA